MTTQHNAITGKDQARLEMARRYQVADFTPEFMAGFDTEEAREIARGMLHRQYRRETARADNEYARRVYG